MPTGRFAPSPTGDLHLGNLRTALAAWLFARSSGSRFLVRMEDLDRVQSSPAHEASQLADLAALGLDWDGEVVRQSDRFDRYEAAIAQLDAAGLTYPCWCTRREIQEAASAPHVGPVPEGAYPGTCRDLDAAGRAERAATGRPPALRLRAQVASATVADDLLGTITAAVDDVVLRRNDGVPAYNLAVVVDDAAQGVEQVVRGDDLASSAPRQRHLADLLGLPAVAYAHLPLVLAPDGRRLAKRDGAVTLADQAAVGRTADAVRELLAASLGLDPGDGRPIELARRFDRTTVPAGPWVPSTALLGG
ncbi:tRNA glutamyl-Q(34) synthetase GluQRS [Aquihabitans sp. G128]|uniref:tRNA glutamyl-Q(34) synthetase GluQRS n=1 Tax=Aquihabitans sp. G128 TaxID=2849779 RepID=UPI001C22F783|nr:tRNA glutamyl-Q(34) synthetase GluQRS [Aquihabitans sp. G128]QXC59710.1 tRNA glutamyl-Q(34) synthetase GluQRS [Aquihabitans sp. G128]